MSEQLTKCLQPSHNIFDISWTIARYLDQVIRCNDIYNDQVVRDKFQNSINDIIFKWVNKINHKYYACVEVDIKI